MVVAAGGATATRATRDAQPRGADPRHPALRPRPAALARRPHQRPVPGRDPAAREHPPRAGDERLAGRDRRARVRPAQRDREPRPRAAHAAAGRPWSAASRTLAGPALAVLLLTGVVQGIIEVGRFGALLDTAFGRAVLIKAIIALAIVALGASTASGIVPALQGRDRLTRPHRRPAAPHPARRARARRPRARHDRRALQLRALDRGLQRPVRDDGQRRPRAHRGHRRPRPRRPQPAAPLPLRPQDRRRLRGRQGAAGHRRRPATDRQAHAQLARRGPGPLRRRRRGAPGQGQVDDRGDAARERLRRVRPALHGADRLTRTVRRSSVKQIAARISATTGQNALKLVRIASRMPATPTRPNAPGGEHEPVGALLTLLAGWPGTGSALEIAHRIQ